LFSSSRAIAAEPAAGGGGTNEALLGTDPEGRYPITRIGGDWAACGFDSVGLFCATLDVTDKQVKLIANKLRLKFRMGIAVGFRLGAPGPSYNAAVARDAAKHSKTVKAFEICK
jgi:hypothetical protein